jgi:hypothetical protein
MRQYIETLGNEAAFDPETVSLLIGAFDIAWKSVQTTDSEYSTEKYSSVVREVLAKHIIEAAKLGERDQRQLAAGALLKLSHSNLNLPSK